VAVDKFQRREYEMAQTAFLPRGIHRLLRGHRRLQILVRGPSKITRARRQLTARCCCVQKRSRRVFLSTFPELFLGRSVFENSTRLGSL
jgi:hypothetical protein